MVDTPGFEDTDLDDEDIFMALADWLDKSYRKGQRLTGLLYLHRIIDTKAKGSNLRNLRMFRKLCGEQNFGNVILGITWWDKEDPDVASAREKTLASNPELWGDMIRHGSEVVRVPLDKEGSIQLLVKLAQKGNTTLQIQDEMFKKNIPARDTSAASEMESYNAIRAIRDNEALERAAQLRVHEERRVRLERETKEKEEEQKRSFEAYQAGLREQAAALARQQELDRKAEEDRKERQRRHEQEMERQKKELEKREEEARKARLKIQIDNLVRLRTAGMSSAARRIKAHIESINSQADLIIMYKESGRPRQGVSRILTYPLADESLKDPSILICCDQCLVQLPCYRSLWGKRAMIPFNYILIPEPTTLTLTPDSLYAV